MYTPSQIANILEREMGPQRGAEYARRKAALGADPASNADYAEAARMLEMQCQKIRVSAESGDFDLGRIP